MYIDSHCHLEGPKFAQDRDEVFQRAEAVAVEAVLAIGNGDGPDDVEVAIRLAESNQSGVKVYASLGVHPHEARLVNEKHYARMTELARNPNVIAWGEIGLDYYYDHSPRNVQKRVFIRQMELAKAAKLPILIHCRPSQNSEDAWQDCLGLIREHWAPSGIGGVLHCFTGEKHHATAALDMGFMISFAGNVTYPKALNIREVAATVPQDRFFIETDSPYLAPVPNRGKRNEPGFVIFTAKSIGELRGLPPEEIGEQTTQNFYRFFKIGNQTNGKA
jgi:TatD DNase family protein